MHIRTHSVVWISFLVASALLALSACSGRGDGGGGTGPGPASSFAIGGTTSGLSGTVVLQNNGGDKLTISVNGGFTFAAALTNSSPYAVTVLAQPAGQTCPVSNGVGTLAGANITNVTVTCAVNTFTVGGTTSGLSGTVVLRNNGGNDLTVSADGSFTFSAPVAQGSPYAVTVLTQPAGQSCRSEEHTSELQSLTNLVCRLLLEKKNNQNTRALLINSDLMIYPPAELITAKPIQTAPDTT